MTDTHHRTVIRAPLLILHAFSLCLFISRPLLAGSLAELAQPHEGKSMRETSTHKIGPDGKFDPNGQPDPNSNWDNKNVGPGDTKGFDEGMPRLDRVQQELIVEPEPDQFRPDLLRSFDRFLMPNGCNLLFGENGRADVAVGCYAEPYRMPLLGI